MPVKCNGYTLGITITACRRADCIQKSIQAVRATGYDMPIHVSIDYVGPESRDVVESAHQDPLALIQVHNPPKGLWQVQNNPYTAYEWAFAQRDCRGGRMFDAILAIEDDCVLSPDAIELCQWYLESGAAESYLFLS